VVSDVEQARAIAHRSGLYAGIDPPVFRYDRAGLLWEVSRVVYRIVAGQRCAFSSIARYEEQAPVCDDTRRRDTQPHVWLAERAEILALALAFPASEVASPTTPARP
jgi:hypothetical protein